MKSRIQEKYNSEFVPKLMEQFSYKNVNEVPRLDKITLSMGIGQAIENNKRIEAATKDLGTISGQKAVVTNAKKSVAGFKLREGVPIGAKVTLRGTRMYEFLDRLINLAIPRIRDFRGFPTRSFDGSGNYSLGLAEQMVFPEVNIDEVEFVQGLNITITVDRSTDEESQVLLGLFGFPFRK
ncbi:MAG: 50S ribosomal protein L5 [Planctomycetes bacterium]|nr:50S ribosomal protein L5 [Planctomycetota bacterium]|tara:strand:+ start:1602 stop:2144 length:543 start_codon:yes stop_codon:yes gene_type:complete